MKVLMENFTENIRDQIPETAELEHYHYRQEEQEKQEEALRNAVIKRQIGSIVEVQLGGSHRLCFV